MQVNSSVQQDAGAWAECPDSFALCQLESVHWRLRLASLVLVVTLLLAVPAYRALVQSAALKYLQDETRTEVSSAARSSACIWHSYDWDYWCAYSGSRQGACPLWQRPARNSSKCRNPCLAGRVLQPCRHVTANSNCASARACCVAGSSLL